MHCRIVFGNIIESKTYEEVITNAICRNGERRWLFRAYNMLLRWKVLVTHGGIDMGDALHTKRV